MERTSELFHFETVERHNRAANTEEPKTPPNRPTTPPSWVEPTICLECTPEKTCSRHVFRLLDLPTELRINIYQKALHRPEPINLVKKLPCVISKIRPIEPGAPIRRVRLHTDDGSPKQVDANYEGHDINAERNKRVPRACLDDLNPALLRVSKQIYHEALPILYRENTFNLHLEFSILALTGLRQRTRSLLKHVVLTIHEHSDVINGGFNDIFTNGLRYCFGLEDLEIISKVPMPRDRSYDLNFHILRWLPKGCKVDVKGERISEGVKKMVDEQNLLAKKLDLVGGTSFSVPAYMKVSAWGGSNEDPPRTVAGSDDVYGVTGWPNRLPDGVATSTRDARRRPY